MISNRTEIENVIEKGKVLLSEHPEFMSMSLQSVINKLDDGTQEMLHNRWGVAAWVVVKSIKKFEPYSLIEQLSKVDSGLLTYEYTGYLLQEDYHINLEDLILEADQKGKFDKIAPYVCSNLVFEKELYEHNICKIIDMLEKHKGSKSYRSFLLNYADHITSLGEQRTVEKVLINFNGQVQYDLMNSMRWGWYKKNVQEAGAVIDRMAKLDSIWCQRAAIAFWESSLHYDKTIFQQYFTQMENVIFENKELCLMTRAKSTII